MNEKRLRPSSAEQQKVCSALQHEHKWAVPRQAAGDHPTYSATIWHVRRTRETTALAHTETNPFGLCSARLTARPPGWRTQNSFTHVKFLTTHPQSKRVRLCCHHSCEDSEPSVPLNPTTGCKSDANRGHRWPIVRSVMLRSPVLSGVGSIYTICECDTPTPREQPQHIKNGC